MGRIKFEFSIEKISFKYEGDHERGQAISESMQRTLASLADAQNNVIDVTPRVEAPALETSAVPIAPAKRRKLRRKPKPTANGDEPQQDASDSTEGDQPNPKPTRVHRPRSQGFTRQTCRLIEEGFFSEPRTSEEVRAELSRKAFNFETKNVASQLNDFVRKEWLVKRHNDDGRWVFSKGPKDDFQRSQGDT